MRYTTAETAALLGISMPKLRWHIYQRQDIVPEKVGNMLFFTDETIAAFRVKLAERAALLAHRARMREAKRRPRATRNAEAQAGMDHDTVLM